MRWRAAVAAAWAAIGLAAPSAGQDAAVSGQISFALPGLTLADVGPAVVYLEAIEAAAARPLQRPAELRQHAARFQPAFLVVAVGQPVEMPNDDTIFHNVFSYSRPNEFDLGLYRSGESRTLQFAHPGPVRIYCSIHERMNGLIFVTPTRLYAIPSASGEFRIEAVPPGRYRLHAWSERLPALARELDLAPAQRARLDLALGAPSD
jgi:plastocyanin